MKGSEDIRDQIFIEAKLNDLPKSVVIELFENYKRSHDGYAPESLRDLLEGVFC